MSWTSWNGRAIRKLTDEAASRAIKSAAEATLEKSKEQVPLDEGTLEESGIVVEGTNDLEWIVSYGGGQGTGFPKVPYAVKWHEVPANFQHGRKHNYLRDPINNFAPQAVKKSLMKELGRVW